jgi:MFS family permease
VQALVFGGGHANYPAQPAYARLVELILPAIGFGLVYFFFGLLPAIIMHFAIDVFWIGLPVFAASGPGTRLDKVVIVALTLVPLWIVLARRLRSGAWREVPQEAFNAAWAPPPPAPPREAPAPAVAAEGLGARARTALFAGGLVGLVVWAVATSFRADAPPLPISRSTATTAARGGLAERGFAPAPPWRELSSVEGSVGLSDRFVWQEGGRESYRRVLGTHLAPPGWLVRYAKFEGDVAERADEYQVWIGADSKLVRVEHTLPEGREGKALEQEQARSIAHDVLRAKFGLDPTALEEVSAEPSQLPKRRDWKFVFADPKVDVGGKGEARIEVRLAGDEVVGASRFVKVPEEWQRKEQDRGARMRLVGIASGVLIAVLVVGAAVTAIVFWTRDRFSVRAFLVVLIGLAILGVVETLNTAWPAAVTTFSTAQPYPLQLAVFLGASLVGALIFAAILGLVVGLVRRWLPPEGARSWTSVAVVGIALGALLAGVRALVSRLAPDTLPTWPDLGAASAYVPWLSVGLGPLRDWIARTAMVLFVVSLLNALTAGWTRRRAVASLLVVIVGWVMTGTSQADTVTMWLLSGLLAGIVFSLTCVFVLRLHPWSTPFAAATMTALGTIREGAFQAHPGALAGSILAIVLLGTCCFFFEKLRRV